MTTNEKVAALQRLMEERGIDTYFVPSADAHQSEYVATYWRARAFMSGFTGSAGTFALTRDKAAVWVDGRYFLQGEAQTKDTCVELMKIGEPGVPTWENWILDNTPEGGVVGVDGSQIGYAPAQKLKTKLAEKNLTLSVKEDLVNEIWENRPSLPKDPIFAFDAAFSGETRVERIARVREHLEKVKADYYLVAALESSAWLLNYRGNDIHCTPVAYAFTLVGKETCDLFIDEDKVNFSVLTLNVDGLPGKIFVFDVNADGPKSEGSERISEYLASKNCDILCLQEDFNYRWEIWSRLFAGYEHDEWSGGIILEEVE